MKSVMCSSWHNEVGLVHLLLVLTIYCKITSKTNNFAIPINSHATLLYYSLESDLHHERLYLSFYHRGLLFPALCFDSVIQYFIDL